MSTLGQDAPATGGLMSTLGQDAPATRGDAPATGVVNQRWGKMPRLRGALMSTLGQDARLRGALMSTLGQDAPATRGVNANVGARCPGYEGG